jgi:hypothetical protein
MFEHTCRCINKGWTGKHRMGAGVSKDPKFTLGRVTTNV